MTLATSYEIFLGFRGLFSLIYTEYRLYTSVLFLFFKLYFKKIHGGGVYERKGLLFPFTLEEELN